MSTHEGKSNELGEFLRARRAEVTPPKVGIPPTGSTIGPPDRAEKKSPTLRP